MARDPLDERALTPPLLVRFGGALLALAGTFTAVAGAQMLLLWRLRPWQAGVAGWLVLLGVAAIGCAPFLLKARAWAALAGGGLTLLMGLSNLVWFIYMLTAMSFSLVVFIAMGATAVALPLVLLSIGPSLRVSAARRAAYDGI